MNIIDCLLKKSTIMEFRYNILYMIKNDYNVIHKYLSQCVEICDQAVKGKHR